MTDLSQVIAEEFGANATYVESLLERFRSNPELVDDSWRSYFNELISDGAGVSQQSGNGAAAAPAPEPKAVAAPAPAPAPAPAVPADAEVVPLRGAALKIVE